MHLNFAGIAGLLLTPLTAHAHHSYSMFDREHPVTLTGTVEEFRFINPHASVSLAVKESRGASAVWNLQLPAPMVLNAAGWRPGTITPGDQLRATIIPLRSGVTAGAVVKVVASDGKVLFERQSLLTPPS